MNKTYKLDFNVQILGTENKKPVNKVWYIGSSTNVFSTLYEDVFLQ
jgi:hypothetical protein